MNNDPVDLIATPEGVLAWYGCGDCGTMEQRDRRLPLGATCVECGAPLTASAQVQFASIRLRLLAVAIDAIILAVPYFIFGFDYAMWGFGRVDPEASKDDHSRVRALAFGLLFAGLLLYQVAGASPGKLAAGIRVVDAETWERPGIVTAILRTAMIFVTAATCGLGYLAMQQDDERRTLHDRIAGTRVIER